ncbi:putative 26S proteasome regulatory subunit [Tulasnella sp. 403]|nr:putative 26S proteasome regulatory subunit [Tulasnella sp. 403]
MTMGRPMYHSPEQTPPPSDLTPRQHAMNLVAKKDALEKELAEQEAILRTNNSNMNTPLVDREGFPRADIDVYTVRHARVRIIELNNDIRDVMDQIALALQAVHSASESGGGTPEAGPTDSATGIPSLGPTGNIAHADRDLRPFARVDGVAPASPANEAGLLRDDLLLQFGTLTWDSFHAGSLQPLAAFVASRENRHIVIRLYP